MLDPSNSPSSGKSKVLPLVHFNLAELRKIDGALECLYERYIDLLDEEEVVLRDKVKRILKQMEREERE